MSPTKFIIYLLKNIFNERKVGSSTECCFKSFIQSLEELDYSFKLISQSFAIPLIVLSRTWAFTNSKTMLKMFHTRMLCKPVLEVFDPQLRQLHLTLDDFIVNYFSWLTWKNPTTVELKLTLARTLVVNDSIYLQLLLCTLLFVCLIQFKTVLDT